MLPARVWQTRADLHRSSSSGTEPASGAFPADLGGDRGSWLRSFGRIPSKENARTPTARLPSSEGLFVAREFRVNGSTLQEPPAQKARMARTRRG
jgi:hypothetical protein